MEKLELKHLAPYLPYNLLMYVRSADKDINRFKLEPNTFDENWNLMPTWAKPILRPLSDLTKDEYCFIYENETDYDSIKDWINLDVESRLSSKFSYIFWQILFNYHFDVFGLIDEGLAIDINTIKT